MADQTPLDLAAIQAREAAATPGPWVTGDGYAPGGIHPNEMVTAGDQPAVEFDDTPQGRADAAFCAAARTDVPALLAEIIALRTRIAGYESALNFQTTCTGCADYLDQLLDRDVEIQRLRAQRDAVLALCDKRWVSYSHGTSGTNSLVAVEKIRAVYGHAPTKPAVDLERPAVIPSGVGAPTGGEQR